MYNDLFIYYIPKFKNNYSELMKLETLMQSLWEKYLKTKDIKFLAKACEEAPFFGQKEMGKEIAKILREFKQ